jgi:4-amino-4-deoxy-L-arabinose transferase-like glycosyltransferase
LWDPDEGRYAEIPREMVASGNWLTPRLNGLLYFEKPPLHYWATALAYKVFGEANWTARLWTALSGLAGVLLAFYAGLRLHSRAAGVVAAAVLASSTLYFAMSQIDTLDMGLSFFLEAAVIALALTLRSATPERERTLWIHVAWIASALAVLTKGLVGIVLPAGALVSYSIAYRDVSIWRKLSPLTGGALFLLVAAPWFVAVSRANPDFAYFFFVHEHFTRFLTHEHHRQQPVWFFVPVFVLGAFPWTMAMLSGWRQAVRFGDDPDAAPFRLLAMWALVVIIFFSASGSKLVPYIVPAFPALALLGARFICQASPSSLANRLFWPALLPAAVLALMPAAFALNWVPKPDRWSAALVAYAYGAAALWAAGAAIAVRMVKQDKLEGAVVALAVAAIAANQVVLVAASTSVPGKTTAALAAQLKPQLRSGTRVYTLQIYPQSLPVYLGSTVTLVNFRGELDFGLAREPEKAIPTIVDFVERWSRERDSIAVMKRPLYEKLTAEGVPMRMVAEDEVLVAVTQP